MQNSHYRAKKSHLVGLTLMEMIIAVVILALTVAGLSNIFISGKRWILHARARMSGGELGKLFLDPLQNEVRQDTWDQANNRLSIPAGPWTGAVVTLDRTDYTPTYTVSRVNDAGGNDIGLRRVRVVIGWQERTP